MLWSSNRSVPIIAAMNRFDERTRGAIGSDFGWPGMSSRLAEATVFRLAGHQLARLRLHGLRCQHGPIRQSLKREARPVPERGIENEKSE